MKRITKWVTLSLAVFTIIAGQSLIANGACRSLANTAQQQGMTDNNTNYQSGQNNEPSGNQFAGGAVDHPCWLIINGEPVMISGTVYAAPYAGLGLTVDTGEELVTVYGIGPQWYWDLLGVDRPEVGEPIDIDAVKVTFSDGTEKIIAVSITIGGDFVQLRDENGRPLWRARGRIF